MRKIDELREAILSNIREQKITIDDTKLTEVNLIKRMVMKRCIYGVDLNEMAVELAGEKRFFHWKVEFPEVFYTERGEKDNWGFDCIIGNHPTLMSMRFLRTIGIF